MLDVAPTELLVIAVVALLVIGPKDLPRAMRFVGQWVGRARGVARQFRSGFDAMVREAELADMEKKWAEENARIMREHPALPEPPYEAQHDGHMPGRAPQFGSDDEAAPAMTAMPVVTDAPPPPPPAEAPPPPPPIRPAF